mgnify:FL=1
MVVLSMVGRFGHGISFNCPFPSDDFLGAKFSDGFKKVIIVVIWLLMVVKFRFRIFSDIDFLFLWVLRYYLVW